ncbi:MAG: GNAT family N-acetyltransferase [Pseudomonadota bacterium]|nr:GNAT family N-acetyltransferase [Pseudomonadota bacterium]
MIREYTNGDFEAILSIINDGARAYRGVIPADQWREPYMPSDELHYEIAAGVRFVVAEAGGSLVAVMGSQPVKDVTLIRHAYVRTEKQQRGEGSRLLQHLMKIEQQPLLIGTWKAARWALRFYEKHGFKLIDGEEKDRLLQTYWDIPPQQVEASVVMADFLAAQRIVTGSGKASDPNRDEAGLGLFKL